MEMSKKPASPEEPADRLLLLEPAEPIDDLRLLVATAVEALEEPVAFVPAAARPI